MSNIPEIIAGIIQAQVGTRDQADLIQEHMKEYFTRWHTYKDRFTELEWYHIFLDFLDKIPTHQSIPAPKIGEERLDIQRFSTLSAERAEKGFKTYKNVPITYWTTALAGEVGELCNMIKKMERVAHGGIDGGSSYTAASLSKNDLAEEVGGIFIYLNILSGLLGIDMEHAIIETFNSKSEKYGFEQKYPSTPPPGESEGGEVPEAFGDWAIKAGDEYSQNNEVEFSPRSVNAFIAGALKAYAKLRQGISLADTQQSSIWDAWDVFEKANEERNPMQVDLRPEATNGKNIWVFKRASAEWGAKYMRNALDEELQKRQSSITALQAQLEESRNDTAVFKEWWEKLKKEAGQNDNARKDVAILTDQLSTCHDALASIVQKSKVLLTNPNCREIADIAGKALKNK